MTGNVTIQCRVSSFGSVVSRSDL